MLGTGTVDKLCLWVASCDYNGTNRKVQHRNRFQLYKIRRYNVLPVCGIQQQTFLDASQSVVVSSKMLLCFFSSLAKIGHPSHDPAVWHPRRAASLFDRKMSPSIDNWRQATETTNGVQIRSTSDGLKRHWLMQSVASWQQCRRSHAVAAAVTANGQV
jgi:hypothetical protein